MTHTVSFDGGVEAVANIYMSGKGYRINYKVSGNTKDYDTAIPPYCD